MTDQKIIEGFVKECQELNRLGVSTPEEFRDVDKLSDSDKEDIIELYDGGMNTSDIVDLMLQLNQI